MCSSVSFLAKCSDALTWLKCLQLSSCDLKTGFPCRKDVGVWIKLALPHPECGCYEKRRKFMHCEGAVLLSVSLVFTVACQIFHKTSQNCQLVKKEAKNLSFKTRPKRNTLLLVARSLTGERQRCCPRWIKCYINIHGKINVLKEVYDNQIGQAKRLSYLTTMTKRLKEWRCFLTRKTSCSSWRFTIILRVCSA